MPKQFPKKIHTAVAAFAQAVTGETLSPEAIAALVQDYAVRRAAEYKIYTTEFDQIVTGAELVPGNTDGLVKQIRRTLDQRKGAKSAPDDHVLRRVPEGSLVTFLLDQSGSERGASWFNQLALVDDCVAMLQRQGAASEVLAATTSTWKGGQSREAWIEAGKPEKPGRLSDAQFIVYKDAGMTRAQMNKRLLAVGEGKMREDVTGEAIAWAYQRSLAQPVQHRALVLLGQQEVVDDSTMNTNGHDYPEHYAKGVLAAIRAAGKTSLIGVIEGDESTLALLLRQQRTLWSHVTNRVLIPDQFRTGERRMVAYNTMLALSRIMHDPLPLPQPKP